MPGSPTRRIPSSPRPEATTRAPGTPTSQAFERLNAKLAEYPKFIPPDDPRKLERERVRNSVMQAELQKSVVDYYEAQTYPPGSKERSELLDKALVAFEDIYKRYRVQMAGFTARMWQGKCFEEQGKLGEATGIYKELLDHPDPALRPLQKQVDYFRIIVMGKRKEYALAADECVELAPACSPRIGGPTRPWASSSSWPRTSSPSCPDLNGADRDKAIRTATDHLTEVVRVVSPFKPEAIALLQKYRPNAASSAADVSKLSYDDAVAQATQAISTLAYENAIVLLKHGHPQGRPDPRSRQGELRPVHAGLRLHDEQAILRGGRGRRARRPALPPRRMGGQVGRPGDAGDRRGL